MSVNRQTPTCPKCGEDIATAKYHDVGLHGPTWIGDTFSHWEYFYHVCNCKHVWVYSDEVSLTNPPIKNKICKVCGKKETEQGELVITEYEELVKKFDALKARTPIMEAIEHIKITSEELINKVKKLAKNYEVSELVNPPTKNFLCVACATSGCYKKSLEVPEVCARDGKTKCFWKEFKGEI